MSKTKTPILPGNVYHLYNHANANQNLFRSDENYLYFLKQYTYYLSDYVDTYSYCLMPNHFHLLIGVKDFIGGEGMEGSDPLKGSELLETMSSSRKVTNAIKNWIISYTSAYNKMYGCKGNLFVQKIRRSLVNNGEYFKNIVCYIHLNPVLHGFVEQPDEWKYSSYSGFFSTKPTKIDKNTVLNYFDNLENFKFCHDLRKIEKFALEME